MRSPFPINFLPKVFVISYQNPILCERFLDDSLVIQASRLIIYRENLISLTT